MAEAREPIGRLTIKAVRYGYPLKLKVYAESRFLAVTESAECRGYRITHKPTGYAIGYWRNVSQAIKAMERIANLDWNFGQRWKCTPKNHDRHAANPKLRAAAEEVIRLLNL